jgi:hypothetical protein
MPITPDVEASVDFLKKVYPDGPWMLTAIRTDRKAIETKTFRPAAETECREWLERMGNAGDRNLYWSVNPTIRDLDKKALREDIKEVCYLHVDVDPREQEDLTEEQARCAALFSDKLPNGVPPPTAVIYSGGGYQGFWKLEAPIPINGEEAAFEEAKRYNRQLEIEFGGDNCHNIDRIMRLPGSLNVPDEKKRKKGRVVALARLASWNPQAVYPLSKFIAAQAVQGPDAGLSTGPAVKVKINSGNIKRLGEINELDQWGVPDRVKVICVQGNHPDEPKQVDNSGSAWTFDACCNLVRAKVPDEVIFSIITDPAFGISEHTLKQPGVEKYAIRQIERAHEQAINPKLRELNEKYAVIQNLGGKCRIVQEIRNEALNRSSLTLMSFQDFHNAHCNVLIEEGVTDKGAPKMVQAGKWWTLHRDRRQYEKVVFEPEREVPGSYNMWKGFAVEARQGDCSLFIDHTRRNICGGNEVYFNYIMGWMARLIQQPGRQGEVAIVLRGGKGVGKSFWANTLGQLLGRHYLQVTNSKHLTGNFNAHLRDVLLLFADEAFFHGDKSQASTLKAIITEKTLAIEAKGVDVENSKNFVHLIMASNDDHVIAASADERRYMVLDVADTEQQKTAYFGAILAQMEAGGYEALLHLLSTYDISTYSVRDVPQTEALGEQKKLSLSPIEEWWHEKLMRGSVFPDDTSWDEIAVKRALHRDYTDHAKQWSIYRPGTPSALGRFISKVCPGVVLTKRKAKYWELNANNQPVQVCEYTNVYLLPTLAGCRKAWDAQFNSGRPSEWPSTEQSSLEVTNRKDGPPF